MTQTLERLADFIPQFVEELDREAERSRRVLLNVPDNMRAWKPHERSMEFGYLADLVATIPHWIAMMVRQDEMDIAPKNRAPQQGPHPETGAAFAAALETAVADAKAALASMDVAHLQDSWRLLVAGNVVSDTSRQLMLRDTMNHWVHHRGQMTVYLRLMGADVPATYGPSADDKRFD